MLEGNRRCIRVDLYFWNMNLCKGETLATTKGDEKEKTEAFNLVIRVTILTPNLSYDNLNNLFKPPPGFSVTNSVIDDPKNLSLELLLKKFIDDQSKTVEEQGHRMETLETDVSLLTKQMKMIEVHLGSYCKLVQFSTKGQTPKYNKGESEEPYECYKLEEWNIL